MKVQDYKSHRRYIFGFHIITLLFIIALLAGSVVNLLHTEHSNLYSASLICLISVILGLMFIYVRQFPLKAQDRAIRAEENLRHYVLSGKLLDRRLRTSQIIALRFASDEEFVQLAKKALEQNMDSHTIKKSILNWKGDFHRV